MGDFTMPTLGADMESGTLLEWRIDVGDSVHRGDIIAVVDTDKSAVDVEVFEDGVVEELLVEPGTEVAVGTPLARIGTASLEAPSEQPAVTTPAAAVTTTAPAAPDDAATRRPPRHQEPTLHSPLVRRLADRLAVDTSHLAGTGPGRRITRDDVERAAAHPPQSTTPHPGAAPPGEASGGGAAGGGASPLARRRAADLGIDLGHVTGSGPGGAIRVRDLPPATDTTDTDTTDTHTTATDRTTPRPDTERRSSIRQAIARQMTTSNRDIPHYHLSRELDVDRAVDWLARRNRGSDTTNRVLPAALLVRATALAVAAQPDLNGYWIDGAFHPADGVHLAVAVALRGGGLQAPVIHHADQLGVDDTMSALRDLVARTRRGSLRSSDVSGASITLTDLGDRGADSVHGIIHPPQVALVGFGRIAERPWAADRMLGVRQTVTATLAGDHRATDGHVGSALLAAIADVLADPDQL